MPLLTYGIVVNVVLDLMQQGFWRAVWIGQGGVVEVDEFILIQQQAECFPDDGSPVQQQVVTLQDMFFVFPWQVSFLQQPCNLFFRPVV